MDLRLITALRSASRVVVFTGAGVSAESGIPTFRDKQTGLWENFDAAELATPLAFERDLAFVWGWYEWRRGLVLKSDPICTANSRNRIAKPAANPMSMRSASPIYRSTARDLNRLDV